MKAKIASLSIGAAVSFFIGVAAFASAPAPSIEPIRATPVRTITITPSPAKLSAEPGVRFSKLDADGCGTISRAGAVDSICRH